MVPSIGYARAAGTQTIDRSSPSNPRRTDSSPQEESFDQAFASARRESQPHRGGERNDKSVERQDAAPRREATQPTPGQKAVKQATPASADTVTAPPEELVPALPLVTETLAAIGKRAPDKTAFADTKRLTATEKNAGNAGSVPAATGNGALIDPSAIAMLLGGGAAPPVTMPRDAATLVPSIAAHGEQEGPVVGNVAPSAQKNTEIPDAGLAFALRLSRDTPVAPENNAAADSDGGTATASAFSNELQAAVGKAITEAKTHETDGASTGASVAAPHLVDAAAVPVAGREAVESTAKTSNTAAVAPAEDPAPPNSPVRAVRVELASDNNQRVAVTLVERSGALSVSVRSADSNLARSLQEHLPDLSARLNDEHYQAEVWTPHIEAPAASTGSSESGHRGFESGGQKQDGQGGFSNPQQQQQGRGDREAPAWFQELAAMARKPQIRSEYLWVQ